MTKEFSVPPVIFPTGTGGNPVATSNLQQRRVPTAPFQPAAAAISSSIPFMSFDIGSVASSFTTGPITGVGSSSSLGAANFDDEEPLLDELGIHPDQIWKKTKSILNPLRVNPIVHKHSSDLSGPIFFYLGLCVFQLLAGKIQFGVILGWIVVASIFLYVVFNMLAGRNGNLDLHTCTSVVGYCMLPVVILSAIFLFVPQGGVVRFVISAVFVIWATRACTGLMVALADGGGEEHHDCGDSINKGPLEIEDEEDLFEIDIEALNSIPPPEYCWERYCSGRALLANCLLPIADISTAIPIASSNRICTLLPGKSNFSTFTEKPMPLRKLLAVAYWDDFGVQHKMVEF